ncbi:LLM class flavin-dependent oxidoreductase [Streptomyces sp. Wh19]|uniref:LLM class flavin-dependent oxidoreductase n=1 Tax=Streptomyces sp. Wh19 TaxID=3076629 RepID=UPI002958ACC3|nr:LLM class flavin-dependent oxidoreductase [Streptomyces sp. Wh19]MDV9194459.1 LLM class flavin-dependent oxidoreductase [Streptomyces sp. Wh19]
MGKLAPDAIDIYTTCPSAVASQRDYLRRVEDVARWSDQAGCKGILVYTDNRQADPWLISHVIVQNTRFLAPLVAVQPLYMHPFAAAKAVSMFGWLYGREIHLNMVAGGFRGDLVALGDQTAHDQRYDRVAEYALIVKQLLSGKSPITFNGTYYTLKGLELNPALAPGLTVKMFTSGSSPASLAAADAVGATAINYPTPPTEQPETDTTGRIRGIRIGVIARNDSATAWQVARARFPEDRRGQFAYALAAKSSDSRWFRRLSTMQDGTYSENSPYWTGPLRNSQSFCPYLVGSYTEVGLEIGRYIEQGNRVFILDVPASEEELDHTASAFGHALRTTK